MRSMTAMAIDVIESLVDQSMLRLETSADGVQRFDLYVAIRDYAAQQLQRKESILGPNGVSLTGSKPQREQQGRHAAYYSQFGQEDFLNRMKGPMGPPLLKTMARELPNFWPPKNSPANTQVQTKIRSRLVPA